MRISTPDQAAAYLRRVMKMDVEEFWVLALDADRNLVASECLFRGTVDACFFHPRDVFRFACRWNASSLLIAHNHPSGNLIPSDDDLRITKDVLAASELLSIPVVDHLVVTKKEAFSFVERGLWSQ
jgi:DNA repair protein RadC